MSEIAHAGSSDLRATSGAGSAPGAPEPGAPPSQASALLERVAAALGGRASVRAVFGEPITRGDVTIVPVARASFGFGGGTGRGWKAAPGEGGGTEVPVEAAEGGDGGGGGGGADVRPLGYVEIVDGRTAWHPIRSAASDGRLFAAGVGLGLLAAAALRGLRRG
jgi:uncharacterized spore protein YtfJ